ncbi:MAG: hypothetical protein Q8859_08555 [Bacteroidota bacterium]|nr:hypothetical protein [Bacteroidota bacterium]
MEKPRTFTHIYGYIVCLVAISVFLTCTTAIVTAIMNKSDPIHSGFSPQNLTSFEAFKLEQIKAFSTKDSEQKEKLLPDDQTLRKIYEAARKDKIDQVIFESKRSILVNGILIVFSLILFWVHWRIARRSSKLIEVKEAVI